MRSALQARFALQQIMLWRAALILIYDRSQSPLQTYIVSLGLSVSHGLPPRVMRPRRVDRGPRGVSGRESAGHFQNVICMCHARQEGPFRQGLTVVPAGSYR